MKIFKELNKRIEVLSQREWDLPGIVKKFENLVRNDIPEKRLNPQEILQSKTSRNGS